MPGFQAGDPFADKTAAPPPSNPFAASFGAAPAPAAPLAPQGDDPFASLL
jgi:hypothetical protein